MLNVTCALAVALTLQSAPAPAPAAEENPDRPFRHFFQNLGRDIVALPSVDSAIVMGMGGAFSGIVHPFDARINNWVDEQPTAGYTKIGGVLGDGWVQGGGAVIVYGIGAWSGQRKLAHIGSDLIRVQAVNALVTRGLKAVIGRERPNGGSHSMPSGHASATFATAAILDRHYGPRVAVPAYAFAAFVGWTRMREDAHWLTDVVMGAAIGTTIGRTVARFHRNDDERQTWHVVPVAGGGRMALYVTRVGR